MIPGKKHISKQQSALSLAILSFLIIIGVGVIMAQYRYNPALLSKDALLPTAEKISHTSPPSADQAFLPLPQDLTPLSAGEMFDAQNLSDKINGKAELYLSAGFVRLISQRFKIEPTSDLWIEVFIYEMASGPNAFSVFSAQRREDSVPLDITPHAYQTPNALFFVHGNFYIEIIASEASDRVAHPMKLLAERFINNTPTEAVATNETELFPQQDLVADSIALVSSDAFGFQALDKVYTAEYELDGAVVMAYLSRRQTSDDADKLSAAYRNFLVNFGGQALEIKLPIKDARLVEILGAYEIIFAHGRYLAGVREAPTIDQAKILVLRLYNRLKEASGES
jgi:hypothetical protein